MLKINNKNTTFSASTSQGRYTPDALSLIAKIKPERYEGKAISIPENITFKHIKACLERFSRYLTLEMNPNNPKEAVVGIKIISYDLIPERVFGTKTLAICDDPKELAVYLRRDWCIPMSLSYSEAPKNIEEFNRWVKNYGGGDKLHFVESEYGDIPNKALEEMTPVQRLRNKKYLFLKWTGDYEDRSGASKDYSHEMVYGKSKEDCYRAMAERIYDMRKYLVKPWGTEHKQEEEQPIDEFKLLKTLVDTQNVCRVVDIPTNTTKCVVEEQSGNEWYTDRNTIKASIKQDPRYAYINKQIDTAGRLVKKVIDLRDVCRPFSPANPLSAKECAIIYLVGLDNVANWDHETIGYKQYVEYIKKEYAGSVDLNDMLHFVNGNFKLCWIYDGDTQFRERVLREIYHISKIHPRY